MNGLHRLLRYNTRLDCLLSMAAVVALLGACGDENAQLLWSDTDQRYENPVPTSKHRSEDVVRVTGLETKPSMDQVVLEADADQASDDPAGQLYTDALAALRSGDRKEAIKLFRNLEDNYSHLDLARQAKLGVAYALFLDGEYEDTIEELNRFLEYYPVHKDIDYVYYLQSASYFNQISGRDARSARVAFDALEVFLRRFPDSRYVHDASLKAREVADILATNHLSIGRFYQDRDSFLAAIRRFQIVVHEYPETAQAPEALHRLVECFTALGIIDEAQQTAQVLASRYPNSDWTGEARTVLASVEPFQGFPNGGAQVVANSLNTVEEEPSSDLGDSQGTAVSLSWEMPLVSNSAQAPSQNDDPFFSINLESALQHQDPPTFVMHPEFQSRRLYITRFTLSGQTWHRLRLGFFKSEKIALQALAGLRSIYPDAWVTLVLPTEVLASAETAIWDSSSYTTSPVVLVEATPESASEPSDTRRSHLGLTIPETTAGTSLADSASDRQLDAPAPALQVASNSSSIESKTDDSTSPPGFRFGGSSYQASPAEVAMLQRWAQPNATTDAENSREQAFASMANSPLSIVSNSTSETWREDEWQQQSTISGELNLSGARLAVGHNYTGYRYREDETFELLTIGPASHWEEDKANDTTLEIGLWDDRLKLTTLQSLSQHKDSDLGDDEVVTGQGVYQGLNVDFLRGDNFSLSVSGGYGFADEDYLGLGGGGGGEDEEETSGSDTETEDEESSAGIIPGSGMEATRYGLDAGFALGSGDLSLSYDKLWETPIDGSGRLDSSDYEVGFDFASLDSRLSYNRSVETEGRGEDRERQTTARYAAEVDYDVQSLQYVLGGSFGETFWNLAPDYISANYSLEQSTISSGARSETTAVGVAASWDWDGSYLSLGYTYSFLDDQDWDSGDNDYRTEGFDIGGGIYGNDWGFDGGLSVSRAESLGRWNESVAFGLDPYVSLSFQPDHLPDVSVSGSLSHYEADYISDGGASMYQSWEILTELDFVKFWPEVLDSEDEALKLVFQVTSDSSLEEWGNDVTRDSILNYFLGIKVDVTLGEHNE